MTTTDDTTTSLTVPATAEAASRYQRLRGHLAALKLHAAAEALPTVMDQATIEQLSLTAALERLLAIEVDATEARRLAGRLRVRTPPTPAIAPTSPPPPIWPPAATAARSRAAGPPPCGSTPDPPCSPSTNSATCRCRPRPPQRCFRLSPNDI